MKFADNGQQNQLMQNLTDIQAGEKISQILTRFATIVVRMDGRIKALTTAAPSDLATIIATLDAGLQSEATTLTTLIDASATAHNITGA